MAYVICPHHNVFNALNTSLTQLINGNYFGASYYFCLEDAIVIDLPLK